jgi:hypothetical protein
MYALDDAEAEPDLTEPPPVELDSRTKESE